MSSTPERIESVNDGTQSTDASVLSSSTVSSKPPHVLISGAGIGGLMLAIILEKAEISYEIFEKSKETRPIGATLSLNPTVFPAFEQLGIYEDLLKISSPISCTHIRDQDTKLLASITVENCKELVGYEYICCGRPQFYDFLLSHVPAHKVHLGKRVVSFLQNKEGVMVRLQDGTTVHGDILAGADGAYSGVRQHLYKELGSLGKLPLSDSKPLTKGYICMVGLTSPQDIEKLSDEKSNGYSHSDNMINSKYTWTTVTLPGNIISWGVVFQPDSKTFVHEHLKNSEWVPEANDLLIKEVSSFKTRYGTIGSLIEATPKDNISRVFLEEKFFETWEHARTALLGDACHKLIPSAGLGAVNAIQDAVVLANCIYEMKDNSFESVEEALKGYRKLRYDEAKLQYETSKFSGKVFYGHTLIERLMRYAIVNLMPQSVHSSNFIKTVMFRPQIAFLPLVSNRGTGAVTPQKPSAKYIAKQKEAVAV
ncbi:hypothetical protein BGZ46_007575 [Entomortierella lignicola]|nr:hypothetical protein BGZ46_007575 [Entomortierella lignicola]